MSDLPGVLRVRVAEVVLPSLAHSLPFQNNFVCRAGSHTQAAGAGQDEEGPCWPSQVPSREWMVRRKRKPRGGTRPRGVKRGRLRGLPDKGCWRPCGKEDPSRGPGFGLRAPKTEGNSALGSAQAAHCQRLEVLIRTIQT